MERVPVSPETATVLGHSAKSETEPLWAGLFLEHAEPATQSTLMLAICGPHEAPVDIHLRVPWCHPSDRTGTPEDWNDCIYRVRPKMEAGKRWKGRLVKFVAFERWKGIWWIAYECEPPKRIRARSRKANPLAHAGAANFARCGRLGKGKSGRGTSLGG